MSDSRDVGPAGENAKLEEIEVKVIAARQIAADLDQKLIAYFLDMVLVEIASCRSNNHQ